MKPAQIERAAPAGTGRPLIEVHYASHDPTSAAPLPTTCAACREPAGPLHGATVWRLCGNCRVLLGDVAAQPLVLARIAATLAAQRASAVAARGGTGRHAALDKVRPVIVQRAIEERDAGRLPSAQQAGKRLQYETQALAEQHGYRLAEDNTPRLIEDWLRAAKVSFPRKKGRRAVL